MFNFSFFENHVLFDNVEKGCRVGQATDKSMANAHCMLDTYVTK